MKTVQTFFEDCMAPSWCNLIKSDFQRVREVFSSFFLFSVKQCCCVLLCKKGKLVTRIKYLSIFEQKFLLGFIFI